MQDSLDRTIGVIDSSSVVVACSDINRIGEIRSNVSSYLFKSETAFTVDGSTYKAIETVDFPEYAVFVEDADCSNVAQSFAALLAISFGSLKKYYDEKHDRGNFIKNVVLENILPGDVYLKARELNFDIETRRVCFLIKVNTKTDLAVRDIVQKLFPDRSKDFVLNVNERDLVLVKEVGKDIRPRALEMLAKSIVDTLTSEYYIHCAVGIGSVVNNIRDLAVSFKEAQIAIEVGKVFDIEKIIISYDNLGIARLIYQLPITLCKMFLDEVFKNGSMDSLDQEILFTIQRFFENNLNVSETSRKLFVHRNTLVYRLEKIKKLTGLDLREFEDAIVFKVALMVKKYLSANLSKF